MGRWADMQAWAEAEQVKKDTRNAAKIAANPQGQKISEVGDRTQNGLACPKCGGTQFKAKRSRRGKVLGTAITLGAGAVLAPKSMVRCTTCKTDYKRG